MIILFDRKKVDAKDVENFIKQNKLDFCYSIQPIEIENAFYPPEGDFVLLTNHHGLQVLNHLSSTINTGIFSGDKTKGDIETVFKEGKVSCEENTLADFDDRIYYCGGAVFKEATIVKKNYPNVDFFLNHHFKDMAIAHSETMLTPALFLDRDGVINHDCGYPSKISDISIYAEIAPIIKKFNEKQWPVLVLTNQSGLARGLFNEDDLKKIHTHMAEVLKKMSCHIDDFFFCPFHEKGSVSELAKNSLLRKPYPLMAINAAEKYHVDLSKSIMIGDKISDKLLGLNIKTLLLKSNYIEEKSDTADSLVFDNHESIYQYLLKNYFL